MKILMVCLGNICRSPLAEGILRHKIKQYNLPWTVASAGTGSWHIGNAPDPRSQRIAERYGIDISKQRAQKFIKSFLDEFDLIIVMDSSNYNDVLSHINDGKLKSKIELIMNYVDPGKNTPVPDPYYDDDLYETVYEMLDKACDRIISKYADVQLANKNVIGEL